MFDIKGNELNCSGFKPKSGLFVSFIPFIKVLSKDFPIDEILADSVQYSAVLSHGYKFFHQILLRENNSEDIFFQHFTLAYFIPFIIVLSKDFLIDGSLADSVQCSAESRLQILSENTIERR